MKPKPAQARTDIITTLATARQARGLSQAALAASTGMPQAQVSRIERGLNVPQVDTLENLAGALDLKLVLVPRQLGPAITALITDYLKSGATPDSRPAEPVPLYRILDEEEDAASEGAGADGIF